MKNRQGIVFYSNGSGCVCVSFVCQCDHWHMLSRACLTQIVQICSDLTIYMCNISLKGTCRRRTRHCWRQETVSFKKLLQCQGVYCDVWLVEALYSIYLRTITYELWTPHASFVSSTEVWIPAPRELSLFLLYKSEIVNISQNKKCKHIFLFNIQIKNTKR